MTTSGFTRREALAGGFLGVAILLHSESANAAGISFSHILGRPTKSTVALSVISSGAAIVFVEFGYSKTKLASKSEVRNLSANLPAVFELTGLTASAKVFYRLRYKSVGENDYQMGTTYSFSTAKSAGKAFAFTVQGDTHPERAGKMFNADLYTVTQQNIVAQAPDFHVLLGDDFSIDPLIGKSQATALNVDKVYSTHRQWLAIAGSSVPIYLVNGNHEQAAKYLLDGTSTNPAVLAGQSRNKYFPLPSTNLFYSADKEQVEHVGLLRDYYSWTWGDATFITLDPYWHSDSAVDNVAGVSNDQNSTNKKSGTGESKTKDLWSVGLGDTQYAWLKATLENCKSKYIFVFAHHVMGTGRGAVEVSYNYEWGGKDPGGKTSFQDQRPNWEMPIHDLMVKHKVSVFFQGHDHIFVTQSRDGLVYQSMPNPADDTFTMFNSDAYTSGTKAPNSGHVRVSVSSAGAKVDYFLAARAKDSARKNLALAHSYTVKPRSVK